MKHTRFLLSIVLLFGLFVAVPAFAQVDDTSSASVDSGVETTDVAATDDAAETAEETVEEEPAEVLEDIEVQDIEKAPSRFGLFFRGLRERVSIAITRDPVKKAEKQIKFAEESVRIAEKIAERVDSPEAQERADKMLERAQAFIARVEERREEFMANPDARKERLLRNIATHHVRRERVLDRIEEKMPEEHLERFEKRREKLEENGRRFLRAIEEGNLPDEVTDHLKNVRERIEDKAIAEKAFRQRRRALLQDAKGGDEDARERLKALKDERKGDLKQIRETFKQKQENFRERVKNDVERLRQQAEEGDEKAAKRLETLKDLRQHFDDNPTRERVERKVDSARERAIKQRRRVQDEKNGVEVVDVKKVKERALQGDEKAKHRVKQINAIQKKEEKKIDNKPAVKQKVKEKVGEAKTPAVKAIRKVKNVKQRAAERRDQVKKELNYNATGADAGSDS